MNYKKLAVKKTDTKNAKKAAPKNDGASTKVKKPAFGGYAINFAGRKETVEQVFGNVPIPPSEMTKKIWTFVKTEKLSNR